jgi:cytochrome P450
LMEHFVAPLPIRVIGELLGVAAAERDNFKAGVEPVLTDTNAPLR